MAAKSQNTLPMMLMVVACMAMLVSTGLAQLAPEPQLITASNLVSIWSPKDVTQCWSSLLKIQGCLAGIFWPIGGQIGIINGQLGISPACCKAISEISVNCWPKLFPINLSIPSFLKSTCYRIVPNTTAKPFSQATLN